ncbi:hypothetical protein RB195_010844 [Necator americanus]|uniref:ACB domain-containing protein n=1 Tax=Necator americanus TaxID=51031 RepID=A0ABR1D0Y0_NECAM
MEETPSDSGRHEEPDPNTNEKFLAAVEIVSCMPKDGPVTTTTDEKLVFYALYKQATVGPCNTPEPAFWNVVEKFKWNAWNDLGEMNSNVARASYVNKLLKKIASVNKSYDAEVLLKDWMHGELYEKLLPKFAIIGLRPSVRISSRKSEKSMEENDYVPKQYPEAIDEEEHSDTRSHSSSPFGNAISDADYVDCDEDGRISKSSNHSVKSYHEVEPRYSRNRSDSVFTRYTHQIEDELKLISQQILNLSNAAEHRHSSLKSIFKKATFYMFMPNGISWKTVLILLVWPFIANMLVKKIRNMIGI